MLDGLRFRPLCRQKWLGGQALLSVWVNAACLIRFFFNNNNYTCGGFIKSPHEYFMSWYIQLNGFSESQCVTCRQTSSTRRLVTEEALWRIFRGEGSLIKLLVTGWLAILPVCCSWSEAAPGLESRASQISLGRVCGHSSLLTCGSVFARFKTVVLDGES